ncbi:YheT family hydrolase [Membranihabitans marinus]|uniref:YheT family hydrolase n=1 Tax=Membranihabitans marinus TaxID=1227546 RepID=UPI001F17102C|nr:alpha/beta fold hydrolase [Membranihabitans marinus]
MPILSNSYIPKYNIFRHNHFSTIYPNLFRKGEIPKYRRERITTPDQDFIDLDIVDQASQKAAIILHGFEGNSKRPYMKGMVSALTQDRWNCIAINYRGCSGEPNKTEKAYHAGELEDLSTVLQHVLKKYSFTDIILIGFSLGGNIVLNYIGRQPLDIIKGGIAISAPIDMVGSPGQLAKWKNRVYHNRFMQNLRQKMKAKRKIYPDLMDYDKVLRAKDLIEIDDQYTAPTYGFSGAEEYYNSVGSLPYLENINIPTLLINASNDSFLSDNCYPHDLAREMDKFYLLNPRSGGHVGFWQANNTYWHEEQSMYFIRQYISSNCQQPSLI